MFTTAMLNTTLLCQGTTVFQCNAEFSAESWNLPTSVEYLCFHGILWNSVPASDKWTNMVRFRQP